MTDVNNASIIVSQSACALIEALGMLCENAERLQRGESIVHSEQKFKDLIEKYGIHWNAVINFLYGR